MRYFPAFFNLNAQEVLIVGAGQVAWRKFTLLARTGARIRLVAPRAEPEFERLAAAGTIGLAVREFLPEDLNGARWVIVATPHRAINRWIAKLADSRGIPANVVDDREASRFIVPAIVDRDPVLLAISTAGTSPVLARRLRERLEALIPARFGDLAVWLSELRDSARERLRNTAARRRYFEAIIDGPAARRLLEGNRGAAERIARQSLAIGPAAPPARGEVVLVGAGPGDPELLTIKALRALQDADVVFHDRLVSPAILEMVRRDAQRICVGKAANAPSTAQSQINAWLIEHARAGKRVVRLKGGDPFMFGRGGEELEALAAARISFSVIPGVTAAAGCAAYAGIPLTHRDHAHRVTFVTGHADGNGREPDWRALAHAGQTVVFYMGLAGLSRIVSCLRDAGAPLTRPAAVIAQGTLPEQRIVCSTLAGIEAAAAAAAPISPALLIIGDVVALSPALSWFGTQSPLQAEKSA